MNIIAIDPGASGGIAWKVEGWGYKAIRMPETEGDLIELFTNGRSDALTAIVEEVSGYAGAEQPGSAMFKFGRNFGFILGALQMARVPVRLVKPQKWIKSLGLGTKSGSTNTQWKNKLKAEAQRRYPKLRVTLATADALLLLAYAEMALAPECKPPCAVTHAQNDLDDLDEIAEAVQREYLTEEAQEDLLRVERKGGRSSPDGDDPRRPDDG